MASRTQLILALLILGFSFSVLPDPACAYGGPGSVLSGIGTLLAALGALLAALFGFIWFPLKRILRRFRDEEETAPTAEAEGATE